ncbi:MAG: hypothetical protein RMJ15_10435 [Nitrososphaerota archaeon]|nr:hypothetical protein [Candidatus Bathyarchaeota archaeon]MDW8024130.1 hypothetical protein [Nitrososphaerota archaeon]
MDLNAKFWRVTLIILMALLIFAGPTYVVYVLSQVLELNHYVSVISGFILFIAGLALMGFLIKQKVIS